MDGSLSGLAEFVGCSTGVFVVAFGLRATRARFTGVSWATVSAAAFFATVFVAGFFILVFGAVVSRLLRVAVFSVFGLAVAVIVTETLVDALVVPLFEGVSDSVFVSLFWSSGDAKGMPEKNVC